MRNRIKKGAQQLDEALDAIESFGGPAADAVRRGAVYARDHIGSPSLEALNKGAEMAREQIVRADDYIQEGIRDNVLRLPNDGSSLPDDAKLRFLRETLGSTVHHARHGYGNSLYRARPVEADIGGLLAGRALQAGGAAGLTAAGVGLLSLTHDYQNTFGGPADSQAMYQEY